MLSAQLIGMSEELSKIAERRVLAAVQQTEWFAQLSPSQQEKLAAFWDQLGSSRLGRVTRGAVLGASLANPIGEAVESGGLAGTADAATHYIAEHGAKTPKVGLSAAGAAVGGPPPTRPMPMATQNPAWRTGAAAPAATVPHGFITPHPSMAAKLPGTPMLPTAATVGTKLKLPGLAVASNATKPMGLAGKLLKVKL